MIPHYYGPAVRIRQERADEPSMDLVVEVFDGAVWKEVMRRNDMSDDMAYTHTHARAQEEQRNYERVHPKSMDAKGRGPTRRTD